MIHFRLTIVDDQTPENDVHFEFPLPAAMIREFLSSGDRVLLTTMAQNLRIAFFKVLERKFPEEHALYQAQRIAGII